MCVKGDNTTNPSVSRDASLLQRRLKELVSYIRKEKHR